MLRTLKAGVRLGGIIIALALVLQFMQPKLAFAQGITLTPSANPPTPGTSVRVDGAGFAAGETITIKFDSTTVGTTPATITTSNPGGTFSGAYFTIPGGASNGSHTVTATGSTGDHASATLVVGPAAPANPALSISKTVDGYTCGTGQCAANVGEILNYQLSVANNGGPTATGVIVTDTLQVGQTFVDATASAGTCTSHNNGDGTTTVSCSIGNLNSLGTAGSTATVVIRAQVTGTASTIANTGYVGTTGAGTTSASNTTTVGVVGSGTTYPCSNYPCTNPCYPYAPGTCTQCPTCNACGYNNCYPCGYPNYTCTGCNYPYTNCNTCGGYSCSPCGGYGCNPYPTGCTTCNPCGYNCNPYPTGCGTCNPYPTGCTTCNTCGYNCNPYPTGCATACNTCATTCNTCGAYCGTAYYGTSTFCGVVTSYNPAGYGSTGTVYMNGNTYVIASGTSFPGVTVTPGQYYCFLYGANQYITGCLSILPVGIDDGGPVKIGREIMD